MHDIPEIVGQPYVVGEQHRGLYRTPPPGTANDLTTPEAVGRELAGLFRLSGRRVQEDVTLLLVDNFTGGWTTVEGLGARLNHGHLVLWHVDEILRGAGYRARRGALLSPEGPWTYAYPGSPHTLTVQTLDTGANARTERPLAPVARSIGQALHDILKHQKRVVVNMSFGLLSCQMLRDIRRYNGDVEDYRRQVQGINRDYELFWRNAFSQSVGLLPAPGRTPNPLLDVIRRFEPERANLIGSGPGKGYVLFFASAGNYGLPFPLFPAQWNEVIAVSAATPAGGQALAPAEGGTGSPEAWSNAGEVASVGQWFMQDSPRVGGRLYYLGTSFAAPTLAVVNALELAVSPTPACSLGGYRSAFHDRPRDAKGQIVWKNAWYEAVLKQKHCLK